MKSGIHCYEGSLDEPGIEKLGSYLTKISCDLSEFSVAKERLCFISRFDRNVLTRFLPCAISFCLSNGFSGFCICLVMSFI
jgi:hypothetical protein